jgi:alpha-beta hydrolase superfamily lysophospholipase
LKLPGRCSDSRCPSHYARGVTVRGCRWQRCARAAGALFAIAAIFSAACGTDAAEPPTPGVQPGPPGELLAQPNESTGYPALDAVAAEALRIFYRSTSGIDGSLSGVSGIVFVPRGDAPTGGWPVASIAHATTGVTNNCAPSRRPDLLGNLSQVEAMLSAGFVTVMSDYQGLGGRGAHPYLEPKTAAHNVIDAVRAARQAVPDTSNTWVTYGFSQGGQAAWAANELASQYGKGLRLAGAVAVSPSTDLRPLGDALVNGTLNADQIVLLPLILKGLQAAHPEFDPNDYLHGVLADRTDVFLSCNGVNSDLKGQVAKSASPDDYRPATPQAADRLRRLLQQDSLPKRRTDAPMLVAYGERDPILNSQWTAEGIRQACALGDILDVRVMPAQGHHIRLPDNPADWLRARLAGIPPKNSCTSM